MDKKSIRQWARKQRDALPEDEYIAFSARIMQTLLDVLEHHYPSPIQLLTYHAFGREVNTNALFAGATHETYVPSVPDEVHMQWWYVEPGTEWQMGRFGINEPVSDVLWEPSEAVSTIVICPLTAFDRSGNRVGMGKGYFDRWLAEHGQDVDAVIGLAFSCQEVPAIPAEPHDIPLSRIITEKESIVCPQV